MRKKCIKQAVELATRVRNNIGHQHYDSAWGQADGLVSLLYCLERKKCKKGKKCNDPK